MSGALIAAALLCALAGLAWLLRGPRVANLLLGLAYLHAAAFVWLLRAGLQGEFDRATLLALARFAIPLSGSGMLAAAAFARAAPLQRLAARLPVWLAWAAGAALCAWGTTSPKFVETWADSSGRSVLVFGAPATWTLIGGLFALVAMAVFLESTYRSAGDEDRRTLVPAMAGFGIALAAVLGAISLSLLFTTFVAVAWLALVFAFAVVGGFGMFTAVDSRIPRVVVADRGARSGRPASVFAVGSYLLLVGLLGEISKRTGLRFSAVGLLTLGVLALLGTLIIFVSNRARRSARQFVDRNFLLSHRDYRREWLRLSERLAPHLGLQGMCEALSEVLLESCSVRDVTVFLRREREETVDLVFSTVPGDSITVSLQEPLMRHLSRTRQPLLLGNRVDDLAAVPVWVENHGVLARTAGRMWLPLWSGGDFVGTVSLGARLNDLRFTYDDVEFLGALAAQVANALWGAQLSEPRTVVPARRAAPPGGSVPSPTR